ncbi:MAG TPA: enoyl-CoA hydratase-related protein [Acidimicrobiales bacterium]|nr:enoyl-CoA hydratase-related protein [Acidimicrobiales bacterium]
MPYEHISYAVDDGIATITLDRPARLNAFTLVMQREICAALDRVDDDDEVRAVVFTGAGRGFCAGVDLGTPGSAFEPDEQGRGGVVTLRIYHSRKPIIGAINGPAVGVGASMILPMDVRLASESARIGYVFARRGLIPDGVSGWFLPRLVGMSVAAEWCYSGRIFDADEALRAGLVHSVHPADELLPRAQELARSMTQHSSAVSIAITRTLLWHMQSEPDPAAAYATESQASNWLGRQPDAAEGISAFLEKRDAQFPMRVSRNMPPFALFDRSDTEEQS